MHFFPKIRHVFLITFTDRALVIIAEALLGPEGTLAFQIYLVSSEEGCFFELGQDWVNVGIEFLKLLNRSASSI